MPSLVVPVEQDARRSRSIVDRLLRRDPQGKSVGIPTDSVTAGWQSYGPGGGANYRSGPRRLAQLATAYGGTNDSVTWVFACVSLIASTAAAYPYHFADLLDKDLQSPPDDLARLLIKPNPDITYFDFVESVLTDLELVGNSYWLKNRLNGLGQPAELRRLVPEQTKIAVTSDGLERGYVYTTVGGVMIPYDGDEVIHFKYPNPLDEHYGMGTVEAIARALDQEIAQSLHVTGFFQNGARISGVLSVPDTLSETQFQRIKHQFMEEFAGPASAWKVLVAEGGKGTGGPDFKPITQAPNALGVVDLRKLSKDEILSGFGIPEFLVGGAAQAGAYKMEEAQHIFLRTMVPKATRYSERVTSDLTTLWGDVKFVVEPYANEPLSVKIEHAREMLGAGAALDEARQVIGLPLLDTDASRSPLVPANLITIDQLYQRPAELLPVPLPTAGTAPPTAPTLPAAETTELEEPEEVAEETEQEEPPEGDKRPGRKDAWRRPVLPAGCERMTRTKASAADEDVFRAMAEHHAAVLAQGVPVVRAGMVSFFTGQRGRVMARLSEYGPAGARGARLQARPTRAKDALTPDGLWDQQQETSALNDAYLPLVDAVGGLALDEPPELSGLTVSWDVTHPDIAAARDRLAEKVTRVNDATRGALRDVVDEGLRRGYSVVQIANGVAAEGYGGVLGVFDAAVHDRAETIARTETAMAYNAATVAGYADAGVELVEVMDGTEFDEACAAADGQVWSLEDAEANDIEHPNCTRNFAPVTDPSAQATGEGE